LSTGNRQRLLLAKTLLHDPDLLLLDEPASGLDPRARAELRGILSELATMGKTIVISSHILADIESICTEVCILEQGRSVLQGGIKELENQRTATVGVFRIRVPTEAMDTAAKVLEGLSDVARCTRDGAELKVASHSTSGNALLGALIERDIEVLEMRRKETDLEDLFLESTEGITS
jgi:ABC-2 type transport system ATP-binding protein